MKKTLIASLIILVFATSASAQYGTVIYPKLTGWDTEEFALPPSFAKEIKYVGREELRFAPGWGKKGNEQYWSYAFLWLVEGAQNLDPKIMQDNVVAYYKGLYLSNTQGKPAPKKGFTTAVIEKAIAAKDEKAAFTGKVHTLDYMTGEPLTLLIRIRV